MQKHKKEPSKNKQFKLLAEAFLQLKTAEECMAFLKDLLTPTELLALQDRWEVCRLLEEKKLSYVEIHEKTQASLTTIGRVARFLHQEPYQGYRLVLDRLAKTDRH